MTRRNLSQRAKRTMPAVLLSIATLLVPRELPAQDEAVWKLGLSGLYLRDGAGGTINVTCSDDAEADKVHFEFTLPSAAGNTEFKTHLENVTGILGERWGWYRTVNGVRQDDELRPFRGKLNISYQTGGMDTVRAEEFIRTIGEIRTDDLVIPKRFRFDATRMYAYASDAHPGLSPQMDVFLPLLITEGSALEIVVSNGTAPQLNWRFDLNLSKSAKTASLAAAEAFFDGCPTSTVVNSAFRLLR